MMESYIVSTEQKYSEITGTEVWVLGQSKIKAYWVDDNGSVVGEADNYLPRGSGRSAVINGVSIKGSGATVYATSSDFNYSHGMCMLRDNVKEAIYLTCIHHVFPDATRALGVIRSDMTVPIPLPAYLSQAEIDALPEYRKSDYASQLVRDFPLRLTHVNTEFGNQKAGLTALHSAYGDKYLGNDIGLVLAIVKQVIDRMAYWWVRRVDTAAWTVDNIDIYGNPLDTANVTFKPDFRNSYTCKGRKLYWDDRLNSYLYLGMHLGTRCLPKEMSNEVFNLLDRTIIDGVKKAKEKHSLALFGLTMEEIENLYALDSDKATKLAKALLTYLETATEVDKFTSDGDKCDSDYLLVRIPRIGSNFREELPKIVLGILPSTEAGIALYRVYNEVIPLISKRDAWLENCKQVNTDISGKLRSVPEVEYKYQELAFGDVPDWEQAVGNQINEAIELFKSTIGKPFK